MSANPVTTADHYENFPVASLLVPARLRPAVAAIYRFARYADDVADEGDAADAERLAELDRLDAALRDPAARHPVVDALRPWMAAHALPAEPFRALLSAFSQDVVTRRYADFGAVLDYCARSANPVGELVLRLFGAHRPDTAAHSDRICTALQLINFLQDVGIDWGKGRVYLPLDELAAAGLGERDIERAAREGRASPELAALLGAQARRAGALLESGAALIGMVPTRLGLELRAIVAGGTRILERLAACGHDPFAARPTLGWRDAPALARLWWQARP